MECWASVTNGSVCVCVYIFINNRFVKIYCHIFIINVYSSTRKFLLHYRFHLKMTCSLCYKLIYWLMFSGFLLHLQHYSTRISQAHIGMLVNVSTVVFSSRKFATFEKGCMWSLPTRYLNSIWEINYVCVTNHKGLESWEINHGVITSHFEGLAVSGGARGGAADGAPPPSVSSCIRHFAIIIDNC